MPRSAGFIVGAIVAAKNMGRAFRPILATGGFIVALSSGLFGMLRADTDYWVIALFFILQGLGMGLQMPCATVLVQNSVAREDLGTAMSGFQFVGSIGGALFVAIFGNVYNKHLGRDLAGLSPYDPATAAAYAARAPAAVTSAVTLVCLACVAPGLLSGILALFVKNFEVTGGEAKAAKASTAEQQGKAEQQEHGEET